MRKTVLGTEMGNERVASKALSSPRNRSNSLGDENLVAALNSTTDCVIVLDINWNVSFINDRAAADFGRGGELAAGKNLWEAYPEQMGTEFDLNYRLALETQRTVRFEGYLVALDRWLEVTAYPAGSQLSIFFRDVTETKRTQAKLYHLAHHDALTGLANRTLFIESLTAAVNEADTSGGKLAVIYADLDDFKSINDLMSHAAGDAVLIEAARRLKDTVGDSTLVARMGGDEFAMLITDKRLVDDLEKLAVRLRDRFAPPFSLTLGDATCHASFGIALYPQGSEQPSDLIKNADLALYAAKRAGGNQHAFFNPEIRQRVQRRLSALRCAREAVAKDGIVPFYQPKICLRTGRIAGFEALLRWKTGRGGFQSPNLIREAFADPTLSVEIGHRMLDRVIKDIRRWQQKGLNFGSIAINASGPEFMRTRYARDLLDRLAAAQVPPSCLEIEVTETVFLEDAAGAVETALNELHSAGVGIALDDFGTGYASLSHLSRFPVSCVKIDRSFVTRMMAEPDAAVIVKAIIGLAKNLNIQTVAEGVETANQWKELSRKGCDVAQGYLIAKPMHADRVPYFLTSWAGVEIAKNDQRVRTIR